MRWNGTLRSSGATRDAERELVFARKTMNRRTDKTGDLVNQVLQAILDGKYEPGETVPSERDLARRIGVSRVTVRRAYAQLKDASVLERRQGQGTTVATGRHGCVQDVRYVGLLTMWGAFGISFLRALEAGVSSSGALLVLRATDGSRAREEEAAMELVAGGIRNLIVWPHGSDFRPAVYERLRVIGANMVFFDRVRPGAIADFVGMDNRDAVRLLVRRGLEDGCKAFAFLGYEKSCADSESERLDALMNLCEAGGIPYACHAISRNGDMDAGLRQARGEGLGSDARTGIVCAHDALAVRARAVLGAAARLYSIDGTPAAVAAGVTTVEQPLARMAAKALSLLREQRTGGAAWRAREFRFKGKLIAA
jgi:DNA-binding LacI/PurR family transcriptional regulator